MDLFYALAHSDLIMVEYPPTMQVPSVGFHNFAGESIAKRLISFFKFDIEVSA